MANYIKPPLLDKTGKEIVAALTGEAVQPSASKINAPISDETGKAILNAIQQGSGGVNVLTLYGGTKNGTSWAYKDPERTQEYTSYDEASAAIKAASMIRIIEIESDDNNMYAFAVLAGGGKGDLGTESVSISMYDANFNLIDVYLWKRDGQIT